MNAHQRRKSSREIHQRAFQKNLGEGDRNELKRFAGFLRDDAVLTPREMVAKHGQYMGLKPHEIEAALGKE